MGIFGTKRIYIGIGAAVVCVIVCLAAGFLAVVYRPEPDSRDLAVGADSGASGLTDVPTRLSGRDREDRNGPAPPVAGKAASEETAAPQASAPEENVPRDEGRAPEDGDTEAAGKTIPNDLGKVIVGGAIICAVTGCLSNRHAGNSNARSAAPRARPSNCLRYGVLGDCPDVDRILANLGTADIAYNKPDSMIRGKPGIISFVVDLTPQPVPASAFRGLRGEIVRAEIPVTRHVSAELWGADGVFDISPPGPVRKEIHELSENRWDWTVKPLAGGSQVLKLKTYVHLTVNGAPMDAIGWKTFEATIPVEVTRSDRIRDLAAEIQPVHAMFLFFLPLAGGAWALVRRRKKTEEPEA
ncbi:hypothetical protein LZ190_02740 [Rhodovulum sulfidophilum]|nr:hypothetical protein [Rhodovulum sulfidophilum]